MQLLELKYTNILRKKGKVDPQTSEALHMKDDSDSFEVYGGVKVEMTEAAAEDPGDEGQNRRGPNKSRFAKAQRVGVSSPPNINARGVKPPRRAPRRRSAVVGSMAVTRHQERVPDPIFVLEKIIASND